MQEGQVVPDVTVTDVTMADDTGAVDLSHGHGGGGGEEVSMLTGSVQDVNVNVNVSEPPPPPAQEMDIPPMPDIAAATATTATAMETNNDGSNNHNEHHLEGTETHNVNPGVGTEEAVNVDSLHMELEIPKVVQEESNHTTKLEDATPLPPPPPQATPTPTTAVAAPSAPNPNPSSITNMEEPAMPKLDTPATTGAGPTIIPIPPTMLHTPPPPHTHIPLRFPHYPPHRQPKSSTKQERMDAIWMKHYGELQAYKVQNGHVRVPRKSGPLGEWVRTQRRYYKLWRRGESVPLTKERMELLDQLGFVWLPAEEKIGGGFRGGRPKKRKREEEDALAAANAAAAAAAAVVGAGGGGSVAGLGGVNSAYAANPAFYHHLASPALNVPGASVINATTMVGQNPDGGEVVVTTNADGTTQQVAVASTATATPTPTTAATATSAATASLTTSTPSATIVTSIPYNYHHDPFYLHSMSKRSDIANQIALLEKHEPINRPQYTSPTNNNNSNPKETHKTQVLTDAHSHYEDVVSVLKRSNEELRDAELALDRAKKTFDQAQTLKDKADKLLEEASEEVLKAELQDGDDEWIAMYKCLLRYKEQNGNILFPRLPSNSSSNQATTSGGNSSINGNEENAGQAGNGSVNGNDREGEDHLVSYGTMNILPEGTTVDSTPGVSAKVEDMSLPIPLPVVTAVDTTTTAATTTEENSNQPPPQATEGLILQNPDDQSPPTTTTTTQVVDDSNQITENLVPKEDETKEVSELGGGGQTVEVVADSTATTTADPATEIKNESEVMDIDRPTTDSVTQGNPANNEVSAQVGTGVEGEVSTADNVTANVDSTAAATTTNESSENAANTVIVTEAVLHEWVGKMRKFPKKQFKKWRRHALDKLGFVW